MTDILKGPEVKLFIRVLSESLTINRHSFSSDFFSRDIKSVSGAEDKIISSANHVVFGRRGSGKSSLLLYSMHKRENSQQPFAWIDMQVYTQRSDNRVIVDILQGILTQARDALTDKSAMESLNIKLQKILNQDEEPPTKEVRLLMPEMKRLFSNLVVPQGDFVIFLDDFHIVEPSIQPLLIQSLYSFTRGNRVYLKLSAIETFTKLWDPSTRTGIESPHDAQQIRLDYNLTIADKANKHICSILDAHAQYCGLPSVRSLCTESDVLNRLIWVAAGVPRDALNIFTLAILKAAMRNQSRITVTNVNVAASELVSDKLRDIELDTSGILSEANLVLTSIRDFCLKQQRKNAFLVEIINDDKTYAVIRQLIDLRLLHVVNEGITTGEAGRKYIALILDYGFYVGMRAAKSVDLFNKYTGTPKAKELRKLPVYVRRTNT